MKSRFVTPFLAAAVGLFALSACGGSSTPAGTAPAEADVVVRAVDGIAWNSKTYTATAGEVVLFAENNSAIAHNLYVVDSGEQVVGVRLDERDRGRARLSGF